MSTSAAARFAWLLVAVSLVAVGSADAEDWPQWRGPRRDGKSSETGLAHAWPSDGPRLVWSATGLGEGFSTPSVAAGSIYTMGNKEGQEWLVALDEATGKLRWQTKIGKVRYEGAGYPGPRSTPTVVAKRVFTLGLAGDIVAASAEDGRILWRYDLVRDYGGEIPNWGYSESILADGPWLVFTPGGTRSTIVAVRADNGRSVWRSALGDGAGYSSIMPATLAGTKQYVQLTARGLVGVDAKTGRSLWRYDKPSNGTANCASPVLLDEAVFAASGYGAGGGMVHIARKGKAFTADEVFFTREMKNHHGGVVEHEGYLYGSDDPGILTCIDTKTGKSTWRDRSCGKCSLVVVDGMLVCRSEKGLVSLAEATPQTFRLLGRFEEANRSNDPAWPYPVVAGGKLYLRDQDRLDVYDLR